MYPHKDIHTLIPRTCECIKLHSKRDFATVIGLRIWGCDSYSSFNIIVKVLIIGEDIKFRRVAGMMHFGHGRGSKNKECK